MIIPCREISSNAEMIAIKVYKSKPWGKDLNFQVYFGEDFENYDVEMFGRIAP